MWWVSLTGDHAVSHVTSKHSNQRAATSRIALCNLYQRRKMVLDRGGNVRIGN